MENLEGKIALVTGGSTGIGLATAQRLAEAGAHVYITGRRPEELDKALKTIGKRATAVRADASSLADLDRLFAQIKQEKGRLDILFANAGTFTFVAPAGCDYRGAVRSDVQHQREGRAVYRAELCR